MMEEGERRREKGENETVRETEREEREKLRDKT